MAEGDEEVGEGLRLTVMLTTMKEFAEVDAVRTRTGKQRGDSGGGRAWHIS